MKKRFSVKFIIVTVLALIVGIVLVVGCFFLLTDYSKPSEHNRNKVSKANKEDKADIQDTQVLQDKSIIFIGDSYGVNYQNSNSSGWIGWIDCFKQAYPRFNVNSSSAVGGAGFLGKVYETFEIQLNDVLVSIEDRTTITDVIVVGGYNDVSAGKSFDEINSAMGSFTQIVKEELPNAKVSFVYASSCKEGMSCKQELYDYRKVFKKACQSNDIVYVEGAEDIINSDNLLYLDETDGNYGYHPSTEGNEKIAEFIADYLLNE